MKDMCGFDATFPSYCDAGAIHQFKFHILIIIPTNLEVLKA